MLNRIIAFSVRNKLVIGLLVLGLTIAGIYNITKLPIDAVPDITNNQVLVITSSPSLGAGDIERLITFPIELATRNIPGIIEQRSFSRFGLSLVTIVFNDKTDVYWARQQVTEKLSQAKSEIPAALGNPVLAPVTTGLGEIFQYVIKPKKGFEKEYTPMELRTIQDWIVRRQLLGVAGVADVSSFGGELKQYEIAINTNKLRSYDITINEIFTALEKNNQNTGGAYIEKNGTVLFIRSEGLVRNKEEIGEIMVKFLPKGIPVYIKDVSDVQLGKATRYGAICYNDEGEVAGGLVMMLKGENSSRVIGAVKDKIKSIEKTLPEGVILEPFLDRTKMVNNAIGTVQTNMLEGALIVVFILVLFLGNLRAGLVVASVIPLSMLFAVIMMNMFGVSGNLMSLGALDFGLIVDGAVIIVEAVMHRLHQQHSFAQGVVISQEQMNKEVEKASAKMMNAAVFGQIIILIVYLPILTLQGIEGKMFTPMAQTVAFAIIGAFLLSLTYVPMMSALVLNKKINHHKTWADKMMVVLEKAYHKTLELVLAKPMIVLLPAIAAFILSVFILSKLGGEFIPELEEGDFAVDTRVLSGSSLTTTIASTQQAAHVLKTQFPEIEKIVTKIGSGEIPTDPMPIEASDMMVILKPKKEWTSAKSFDELAEKMSKALEDVPGITTGFQFPVQMRFNELMTGGRQDVVCKIFGENIDSLAKYAEQLGAVAAGIEGASDLYVETVTGLPQIVVKYNRQALAQYGLPISEVNQTIQSAFAGAVTGQVFENERRFDLVVRLGNENRNNIEDVKNLLIATPAGEHIPLYLVADAAIVSGPNQIQREDAQRRITVGFNVRGRDIETVVKDLQMKVNNNLQLPSAYYITYGGAFQNLIDAKKRLSIAVPISLLLIFVLLYFAFASVKQGLLIYSAIPLSAIGGVLALWIRGMPFSISAGVGFIALFGVAVLNGIVLISEFNQLKKMGIMNIKERILKGASTRLRPVLMTASVASLGFLPMALSNGAGAEVQRPLATVVIGGLITATLLTLVALPVLYHLFEKNAPKGKPPHSAIVMLLLALGLPMLNHAQMKMGVQQALDSAVKNNYMLQSAAIQTASQRKLEGTAWELPSTSLNAEFGKINSTNSDNRFGISQSMAFPAVYQKQKALLQMQTQSSFLQESILQHQLKLNVVQTYYQWQLLIAKKELLAYADSLFSNYEQLQQRRLNAGEANNMELSAATTQKSIVKQQLLLINADIRNTALQFNQLIKCTNWYEPTLKEPMVPWPLLSDTILLNGHPYLQWKEKQQSIIHQQAQVEKARLLPSFSLGYVNQSFNGEQFVNGSIEKFTGSNRFGSVTAGIGIPLFSSAVRSRIAAAKMQIQAESLELKLLTENNQMQLSQYAATALEASKSISLLKNNGFTSSQQLLKNAQLQLNAGQINYLEWIMIANQQISLQNSYLDAIERYNTAVILQYHLLNKL